MTRDGVPMLANPFNWCVRWPGQARVPLFSLRLRVLEVHVATGGGWLSRYRPREVRNSIYRYRKIHIDYRSKFLYRFISPISIIYGNTTNGYEMMHKGWSSIVEVPYCFWRSSIKFQGHTAKKIIDFDQNWAFPDCNSSLNSLMAVKWYTKLEAT